MKKLSFLFISFLFLSACNSATNTTLPVALPPTSEPSTTTSLDQNTYSILLTLDPNSEECTKGAVERPEIGGMQLPVDAAYSMHATSDLGPLFTAMACGDARVKELFPDGKTTGGIYISFESEPTSDITSIMTEIGFKYDEKQSNNRPVWSLKKKVDVNTLAPLRALVVDQWWSNWGGLSE